jgi:ABC-2 type transport system ATP-binding protein
MNLMAGLIRPSSGEVSILGTGPDKPEELYRLVGYCTQYDNFPKGLTGYEFVYSFLRVHGNGHADAQRLAWRALDRAGMTEPAHRKVAGYSKGMRQRVKLAQAIAHGPAVLILDEPLNGLDPMARAETIALFEELGREGLHVIVSSHILHEVDKISDQVILLSHGYVVAEGEIQGVRSEVKEHPMQILVRCNRPGSLAAILFREGLIVEARVVEDGGAVLVRVPEPERFYLALNDIVLGGGILLEAVSPADEDVNSVYQYLIGSEGGTA